MHIPVPTEAQEACAAVEAVFSNSIVGIYLYGSAVMSSLKPDSDVDVLVALNRKTTFTERKMLAGRLLGISGEIGNSNSIWPLELTIVQVADVVPWRFPPSEEFLYGEWLRHRIVNGLVPEPRSNPDLAILLRKAIESSVALYGDEAAAVFEPISTKDIQFAILASLRDLLEELEGDERNTILTLARMWYTAATGEITSKERAAEWVEKQIGERHAILIREARMAYLGLIEDEWQSKRAELENLTSRMKSEIEACLRD
ncbi:aminoglycoside nucleotidyltransferase ANT9 [Pseudovibrio japonicus]|uniref:Aminoglycoside (3'') (9) adenylyltransferase n=1 Tax=Pseudovibrio japonicus TaxID=366534 RepID=A0ABQ3EPM8_9HYPH|nr:aminoglycoside adenylyltransferase family protein [Pseudovibrio japonicus]GHB50277.1 aminoglycoside nucleotidyltransferase ANT9 [Pseudovibrio japonicus]